MAPAVENVLVNGVVNYSVLYSERSTVVLTATLNDTDSGGDDIAGANYTVGMANWPGASMTPDDIPLDSPVEDFSAIVDISTWAVGTYDLYPYGWDISNDYNSTSDLHASVTISDDLPPEIYDARVNGLVTYETDNSAAGTVTLTGLVDDTMTGSSLIAGADYTIGQAAWGTSQSMTPDNDLDTDSEAFTVQIDISSWAPGVYNLYIYGWDTVPAYNDTSTEHATIVIHDVLAPAVTNVRINGSIVHTISNKNATTVDLTALVDDTGHGDSIIGGANFTIGNYNWPGMSMSTYNDEALSDIPVEGIVSSDDYSAPNDYLNTAQFPDDGRYEHIQESGTGIGTTEYTYNGITSPSGTHVARRLDVDAMPPTGNNINQNAEATTTQYGQITNSDNSRWVTADPGWSDENFMWSEFQIAEDISDITEIVISFEGQGNQATDFDLWVLDSGTWTYTGSSVSCSADTDGTVIHSFTSGFANIVQGGVLTWGAYQTDSSDFIRVDKMNATVRWILPSEHRWQFNMGANPTFYIDASNPAGSDSDFTMEWSSNGGGTWNGFSTPIVFTPGEVDVLKSSPISLATYYPNFLVRMIATNMVGPSIDTFSIDRMWAEGQFNNNPEAVYATVDISTWQPGTYSLFVYGWDSIPQYNTTSRAYATLVITDAEGPEIYDFLANGVKSYTGTLDDSIAFTGMVSDANTGRSNILNAFVTDGEQNWNSSWKMTNDTWLDSINETFSAWKLKNHC
jgi:hypothetical protein